MSTCIVIFGRMNLPHNGHGLLFEKALFLQRENPEKDIKIFLSTQCNIKNPLPFDVKKEYIKRLFPCIANFVEDKSYSELFSIMRYLDEKYQNIELLVGSDRVQHFEEILNRYNYSQYDYDTITVHNCGERSSNDLSGTSMRSYVHSKDYEKFSTSLPDVSDELKQEFYKTSARYMNVKT
ncbi:cytidyltransferase [Xanthomonas phage XaC1]|nr:cytidyltransferase [Xanthomonas phage XaC1]